MQALDAVANALQKDMYLLLNGFVCLLLLLLQHVISFSELPPMDLINSLVDVNEYY